MAGIQSAVGMLSILQCLSPQLGKLDWLGTGITKALSFTWLVSGLVRSFPGAAVTKYYMKCVLFKTTEMYSQSSGV